MHLQVRKTLISVSLLTLFVASSFVLLAGCGNGSTSDNTPVVPPKGAGTATVQTHGLPGGPAKPVTSKPSAQ